MAFLRKGLVAAALAAMLSHALAAEPALPPGQKAGAKAFKLSPGKAAGLLQARGLGGSSGLFFSGMGSAGSAFMAVVGYGLGPNQISVVATTGTAP